MAVERPPDRSRGSRLQAAALALALLGLGLVAPAARAQSQAELQGYQERLQKLFEKLDRNGDGRLEPTEVEGQAYLQKHFNRLDQQQRGYLIPNDLRAPSNAPNGERVRRFFSRADLNGDGQLSRQEAAAYAWLERRFNEADRNGDGEISREELRQLRRSAQAGTTDLR